MLVTKLAFNVMEHPLAAPNVVSIIFCIFIRTIVWLIALPAILKIQLRTIVMFVRITA